MIQSITFQGLQNFSANLYALEVKSRFIDQSKAHGYYTGYGNELPATVVGSNVVIGTGAFVICARMATVVSDESVAVSVVNGNVGYIVAHIETYHLSDDFNVRFIAKTGASLAAIPLTQEDIYAAVAETTNKVYEYPIYSFTMSGGSIQNLVKTLSPVADYATVKQIADLANSAANSAVGAAQTANQTANAADTKSKTAVETANAADTKSDAAVVVSNAAKATAEGAVADIAKYKTDTTNAVANYQNATTETVENLAQQIGEKQGTTITKGGNALGNLAIDGYIEDGDVININGGKA